MNPSIWWLCAAVLLTACPAQEPDGPPQAKTISQGSDDLRSKLEKVGQPAAVDGVPPAVLAAAFPEVARLDADRQQLVAGYASLATAPCEPCAGQGIAHCAVDPPAGCENLPGLVRRLARMAAAGVPTQVMNDAVSYGDFWMPHAVDRATWPEAGRPLVVELWVDLEAPMLDRSLRTLDGLDHAKVGLVFRASATGEPALAHAAAAADLQGAWVRFAQAYAALPPEAEDAPLAAAQATPGLDLDRWQQDRQSPEVQQRVSQDAQLGTELGVRASPTWFVQGYRLRGAQDPRNVQRLVAQEWSDVAAQDSTPVTP